jgi:hypothetical protein
MIDVDLKVLVLERLLATVNTELKRIIPLVTSPAFFDSDVRKSVIKSEKLSRWSRYHVPPGSDAYALAFARAELKAQAECEAFVVVEKDGVDSLIIMPKARLIEERPFGSSEDDIIYTATGAKG